MLKKRHLFSLIGLPLLATYFLLFGKLFPYSPYLIGFEKIECRNVVIYLQHGSDYNDFTRIDTLIPGVEKFHELEFKNKPKIFIFSDSLRYRRLSPSMARFCVFFNSRLFISPWALQEALQNKISLEIYMTHELSHSLLHQHAGVIHAMQYPEWLLEGLAIYSAKQQGTSIYPDKETSYQAIREGNFMPPQYFKTKLEDEVILNVPNPIAFEYSEFGFLVEFMVSSYGKDKLLQFVKQLLDGGNEVKLFKEIYGFDFDELILDFRTFVEKGY